MPLLLSEGLLQHKSIVVLHALWVMSQVVVIVSQEWARWCLPIRHNQRPLVSAVCSPVAIMHHKGGPHWAMEFSLLLRMPQQ